MTTPTDAELIEQMRGPWPPDQAYCAASADRLAALAAENERLREALEKYADAKNWRAVLTSHWPEYVWCLARGGWEPAREALKEPNDAN